MSYMGRIVAKLGDKYAMFSTVVDDLIWFPQEREEFLKMVAEEAAASAREEWTKALDEADKNSICYNRSGYTSIHDLPGKETKKAIKKFNKSQQHG